MNGVQKRRKQAQNKFQRNFTQTEQKLEEASKEACKKLTTRSLWEVLSKFKEVLRRLHGRLMEVPKKPKATSHGNLEESA